MLAAGPAPPSGHAAPAPRVGPVSPSATAPLLTTACCHGSAAAPSTRRKTRWDPGRPRDVPRPRCNNALRPPTAARSAPASNSAAPPASLRVPAQPLQHRLLDGAAQRRAFVPAPRLCAARPARLRPAPRPAGTARPAPPRRNAPPQRAPWWPRAASPRAASVRRCLSRIHRITEVAKDL